jgi:glycolate oxidase FAD binding subunit
VSAVLEVSDPVLLDFARVVGEVGPVAVAGGRTRWELGGRLDPGTRELAAPSGIVAHIPAEMTVKVRAGTAVADLHRELADRGQRTALPERGGTVGGAVAVGENHLDRRIRGTVATCVLQVRYVSAEGRMVTGGGPTVKNVTGYDLPRLMTGALGTLGLLAELILRTNPIPSVSRWVVCDEADPFALDDLLLRPSAVLWDGGRTWVHLEGHGPDVDADLARLSQLAPFSEVGGPPVLPPRRWSLPPARLRSLGSGRATPEGIPASPQDAVARAGGLPVAPFVASVGVGTVWASSPTPVATPDPVAAGVSRRLKANFDPTGRLNPGRRVGW